MESNQTEVLPYLFCDIHGPIQPAAQGTINAPPVCPTCSTVLTAQPNARWSAKLAAMAADGPTARTARLQGAFLAAYAEAARIDMAAKAANISRQTHYDWLKNDPQYPTLFAEAEELAAQTLLDEAVRRGREGWDEPVTVAGEKVLIRRYSDRLMERLLEAKFPLLFRSNLAHRLVDKDGKDREVIDFSALDKLIRAADERDKEPTA